MFRCPICKVKLEVKDYSDYDWDESYHSCKVGCRMYNYETWCGNWKFKLGETELVSHYLDSYTQKKKKSFIFERCVKRLRKKYLKNNKRY